MRGRSGGQVMDTVGRLVFDRIRGKAEREDDGTFVAVLPTSPCA